MPCAWVEVRRYIRTGSGVAFDQRRQPCAAGAHRIFGASEDVERKALLDSRELSGISQTRTLGEERSHRFGCESKAAERVGDIGVDLLRVTAQPVEIRPCGLEGGVEGR